MIVAYSLMQDSNFYYVHLGANPDLIAADYDC